MYKDIKLDLLRERFIETAKYDISEDKLIKAWDHYEQVFKKEKSNGK